MGGQQPLHAVHMCGVMSVTPTRGAHVLNAAMTWLLAAGETEGADVVWHVHYHEPVYFPVGEVVRDDGVVLAWEGVEEASSTRAPPGCLDLHFERAVRTAQTLFERLVPGEEFLPTPPPNPYSQQEDHTPMDEGGDWDTVEVPVSLKDTSKGEEKEDGHDGGHGDTGAAEIAAAPNAIGGGESNVDSDDKGTGKDSGTDGVDGGTGGGGGGAAVSAGGGGDDEGVANSGEVDGGDNKVAEGTAAGGGGDGNGGGTGGGDGDGGGVGDGASAAAVGDDDNVEGKSEGDS